LPKYNFKVNLKKRDFLYLEKLLNYPMVKIVVLDGGTLNPGDISWESIESLGDSFTLYQRTEQEEIPQRAKGVEILLTNKTVLTKDTLKLLPELRYIGVLATGYNVVDTIAAKDLGIIVTNVPAYGTSAVAQYTIGLILELASHIGHHARMVKKGRWTESKDFCFWDFPLMELQGKTLGIIGLGAIGSEVASIALALKMRVIAHNGKRVPKNPIVPCLSLEELFRVSDIISLHLPLKPDNALMINQKTIAMMKDGVIIINAARGGHIDEKALTEALESGKVGSAALDVLSSEPPSADNPLLHAKRCLITPHLGWAPKEARTRLIEIAANNISMYLKNNPVNVVNN
jgi:glycerate dehydrogenase